MSLHQQVVSVYAELPAWSQRMLAGAAVLLLGWIAIKLVRGYVVGLLQRSDRVDPTVRSFTTRLVSTASWVLVIVWFLATLGVDPAALVGGLAIGGFVVGFAVKDTLGNLAAGLVLLVNRPFSVGETVTVAGETGTVDALGIAMTWIKAADARLVTVPNGNVLGGVIINHTRLPHRRADVSVGIAYGADIDVAVGAIVAAVAGDARVLTEPPPDVRITGLDESCVGLQVRAWVSTGDFWQTKADLHGTIKKALDQAGVEIPFPQRDLHVRGGGLGDVLKRLRGQDD